MPLTKALHLNAVSLEIHIYGIMIVVENNVNILDIIGTLENSKYLNYIVINEKLIKILINTLINNTN